MSVFRKTSYPLCRYPNSYGDDVTHSIPTAPPAPTTVDVVLPCLDEALALPWVLGRMPAGWRAIVVDNGSADGSAEIAAGLGATVVREPRRGFGAACHAGLLAAEAEFVCFCDCDASLDPGLLPAFVAEVAAGRAELVLGRRRPRPRRAWPPHARAGNLALARMLRRRTGLRLHDLGPMRAARREPLLDLSLTDRRSGYPLQMVVRAADAGWRVTERDVPYLPRRGKSKVTGTWRGTWQAVHDMRAVLAQPPVAADRSGAAGTTAPAAGPERSAQQPTTTTAAARTTADAVRTGVVGAAPSGAASTAHDAVSAAAGHTAPQSDTGPAGADRTAHRSADAHEAVRTAAAPPHVRPGDGPAVNDRVDTGPVATAAVVATESEPCEAKDPMADDGDGAGRTTGAPPTDAPGNSRDNAGRATAGPLADSRPGTEPAADRPGAGTAGIPRLEAS